MHEQCDCVERLTALLKEADDERLAFKEHYPKLRSQLAQARAERDGLAKALRNLVKMNVEHNEAVEAVIGRPVNWSDNYLDEARAALATLPTAPERKDERRKPYLYENKVKAPKEADDAR